MVKDWDAADGPVGADVPGRVRGRAAQPGRADPLRDPQRAARRPGRAHLRGLAGPREADARARRAAVHRGRAPAGERLRPASASPSPPSSATPTCSPRSTWPDPAAGAADRDDDDPMVVAGGHAAFNPEPIADFIDAAVLGDGEEAVLAITAIVRELEGARAARAAATSCCSGWPARGGLRAALLRRGLPAGRADPAGRAEPAGRAVPGHKRTTMDLDAWPYPKQPLVPLAETVHERYARGDLPRLHPGLPVLPGRHDHPPGPGAVDHHASARWSRRGWSSPASTRWACCPSPAPTTARSATSAPAWPTSTRAPSLALAAVAPGSTPSTSPRRGAVPQRAPHRADLRARGRLGADPQGDQQDGHRGGPDPHRRHRVLATAGAR